MLMRMRAAIRAADACVRESRAGYVDEQDRYLVLFVAGYRDHEAVGPLDAANLALELTRNAVLKGSTLWAVIDRREGTVVWLEQGMFEGVREIGLKEVA